MSASKPAEKKKKTNAEVPALRIPRLTLLLAIVLLGFLVWFVVSHLGDAEQFALLLTKAKPGWLIVALLFQIATYVSAGGVWGVVARTDEHKLPLRVLPRLAVEKLSVDQIVPTGGLSGNIVVMRAMRRYGIPDWLAMEALLLDSLAFYAAFAFAALSALFILWLDNAITSVILYILGVFGVVLVAITLGIVWLLKHKDRQLPRWLMRSKSVSGMMEMAKQVSVKRVTRPGMISIAALFNFSVFVLDGFTLWAMMNAIGVEVSIFTAYTALVIACVAGTISFMPGGIGGFETGAVTALTLLGVPVEAAFTGTMLLRGFTLWIPLIPGILLARKDVNITFRKPKDSGKTNP